MSRIKILLITKALDYRGTPRIVSEYAHILSTKYEVCIWGYESGGQIAGELLRDGFFVLIGKNNLIHALKFAPDIVNIHHDGLHSKSESDLLLKFRQQGARIIETSVFGRVNSHSEDLFDLIIHISHWDLWRWNRWKGSIKTPAVYVPNIVDTESFVRASKEEIYQFRQSYGLKENDFVIGRIGKTNWQKISTPLKHLLHGEFQVVVLSVDDYDNKPPHVLQQYKNFHIVPRLRDKKSLALFYSSCNLLINASYIGESFGMVIAESMSCGTPVAVLSTPWRDNAQIELVEQGRVGYVMTSASALPMLVKKIKKDSSRHFQICQMCRQSIVSRYARKTVAPLLEEAFTKFGKANLTQTIPNDEMKIACKGMLAHLVNSRIGYITRCIICKLKEFI